MRKVVFLLLLLSTTGALCAQNYDEIARLRDMNQSVSGIRSMADGQSYTTLTDNSVVRYSYADQSVCDTLFTAPDEAFKVGDYSLSKDEKSILVARGKRPIYRHSYTTQYYLSTDKGVNRVFPEIQYARDASFSHNGKMIAFSSRNNLYLYNVANERTVQVTLDGKWNSIINGTTDWVYEEEFGFTRAYVFSPDNRKIAYLRFDESKVPIFQLMRYDGKLYNKASSFKYPKAGDKNSIVELWVYDIASKKSVRIDTGAETDQYISSLGWTTDGKLYFYRLNRKQNHFEVVLCDSNTSQRVIYDKRSPDYVSSKRIKFCDKNRFIAQQESTAGYVHLYLYDVEKGLVNAITSGDWEVTELVGTTSDKVYYISTETSPMRRNLYSIDYDGQNKKRLTQGEGYYTISPSRDMKYYIATFSNASTPNSYDVYASDGRHVRNLKDNAELRSALREREQPVKEFFTFTTERGDTLNAYIIKPRNFDPAKKYPILLTQYSGPGSQEVSDKWSMDWVDALVDADYVVACADVRGTGYRGAAFRKQTYGKLGAMEVEDQISFAKYLSTQSYVDASRIGIYGWSYGGFMALGCAFKGEGLFKMAIAVAPVTSWRYYNTVYTEVYNDLPQDNAAGYDDNSPINYAETFDDKRTQLLIIHGTADDNVHIQNTMELARKLNKLGKSYDIMIYPDQNHSMLPDDKNNVRRKMTDYTLRNL